MKATIFIHMILLFSSCVKETVKPVDLNMSDVKDNFSPLPSFVIDPTLPINAKKIALGKRLYFEKALSLNNDISCNSCHLLDKYGVDSEATSPGHKTQRGDRNSPTVYNASLHIAQFWDGRAEDLKEQAKGPILNPVEMALPDAETAVKKIRSIDGYVDMFKAAYPKSPSLTYDNLADAIASFEKNLLTPSRFDDFLNGKTNALTHQEKEGLKEFMDVGCISCHNGVAVGGELYQKIGLEVAYPTKDFGRFNVTKDPDDKFVFKVPSLRNIEKTAPYFHDGSIKDLETAITLMGKHQLAIDLTKKQITSIASFLKSLTGKIPSEHVK